MIRKDTILVCTWIATLMVAGIGLSFGQSNLKEGSNQFALYTKSGDIKQLEAARKFSDEAYKTRRDTLSFRNNLLRALVYSSLSVADSNRKQKYQEDPLLITEKALSKLKDKQLLFENEPEVNHVTRYLSNGYLIKANKALKAGKPEDAYLSFRKVDSIDSKTYQVKHNLAVLSDQLGKYDEAATRYMALLGSPRLAKPDYIQALADIYEKQQKEQQVLEILVRGREQYPNDKDILFRLINQYKRLGAYDGIVPLAEDAVRQDPGNTYLHYIVAYAYDVTGNRNQARQYYEKVIALDKNSFEGNYGIGLIYLREYLENTRSRSLQNKAKDFLLKANQIRPSAVNTLQSLAILYRTTGDIVQLERVNNRLDQLTLN